MKLLFDQNLSHRLVAQFESSYPGSAHVRDFGLQDASDEEVWTFAKVGAYTVVSKDADFHQRSFLYGHPPRVIWLRVGNCTTGRILATLIRAERRIAEFHRSRESAFLVLGESEGASSR